MICSTPASSAAWAKLCASLAIALFKAPFTSGHRVHEVIRCFTTGQSRCERAAIEHVAGDYFHFIAPPPAQKLPRIPPDSGLDIPWPQAAAQGGHRYSRSHR